MPVVGEKQRGQNIGKRGNHLYIWKACEMCGQLRWVAASPYHAEPSKLCRDCYRTGISTAGNKGQNWQGGRWITSGGYVEIYVPSSDFFFSMARKTRGKRLRRHGGYVREHRLVMAKHLGRCLQDWEIVHHKNGQKDDTRLENLELGESAGNHSKQHSEGYKHGYQLGLLAGKDWAIEVLKGRIRNLEETIAKLRNERSGVSSISS